MTQILPLWEKENTSKKCIRFTKMQDKRKQPVNFAQERHEIPEP